MPSLSTRFLFSASNPADTSTLSVGGLPADITLAAGAVSVAPFKTATITGSSDRVTATITLSDPTVATLDIPAFEAIEHANVAIDYGYGSTFSGLYRELDITGQEDDVAAALRQVLVEPVAAEKAGIATETMTLDVAAGSEDVTHAIALSVQQQAISLAYTATPAMT